jgi:hypothetical protein
MSHAISDEEAGRQILSIFVRNKVTASGTLRRIHFFDVRDGDFQRGINRAVFNRWITVHQRDRYRYILTEEGYAAGKLTEAPGTTGTQMKAPAQAIIQSPVRIEASARTQVPVAAQVPAEAKAQRPA